jgi:hypothetical protein
LVEHFPDALRSRHDCGRISGDALGGRLRRCLPHPSRSPSRPRPGGVILRNELGVSLHPEKTRIVHVDHGFEFLGYKVKRGKGLRLSAAKRTSQANPYNFYAVPREKSVARFKDQIRNLTQRRALVTLRDMIAVINPIIRGWGNYYRKANVRKLFHRLDGWIERRLWSFISKRWRNTAWRGYPTSCLIADFGLVRLIHLVPGIRPNLRQPARPT